MRCSYPGHAMARDCPPERFLVRSPPDRLGRIRTYEVCENALPYALSRGYVLEEREP